MTIPTERDALQSGRKHRQLKAASIQANLGDRCDAATHLSLRAVKKRRVKPSLSRTASLEAGRRREERGSRAAASPGPAQASA
jgi:hypothetical protein